MEIGKSYVVPVWFVILMWTVFIADLILPFPFARLGIYPRSVRGLTGIFFSPLIHVSLVHLISNTLPILFLGMILFIFYQRIATKVLFLGYFLTNILVWVFGRVSYHIGASGLIYCLASFLIFFGIFRRDFISLIITVLIIFLYGGLLYGILPVQQGVSWESHLLGGIVGFLIASGLSNTKNVRS